MREIEIDARAVAIAERAVGDGDETIPAGADAFHLLAAPADDRAVPENFCVMKRRQSDIDHRIVGDVPAITSSRIGGKRGDTGESLLHAAIHGDRIKSE